MPLTSLSVKILAIFRLFLKGQFCALASWFQAGVFQLLGTGRRRSSIGGGKGQREGTGL